VFHDLLGIREGVGAKFVRRYADLQDAMADGVAQYAADVRAGVFPAAEHGYGIDQAELARFRALRNGHPTAAAPLTRSGT
jgi:3-methyl-2-oxobutanoate hydroxymethyltransferase